MVETIDSALPSHSTNSISFWLPSLPGSLNDLYELNRPDSGLPRKRLKAEWSLWASKMMPYVPPFAIAKTSVLRVDRCYYCPYFYKNGNWRKVDIVNMDALLFNLVTRKIGIDDSMVKQGMLDSRDSEDNKVQVVITEVPSDQWKQQRKPMQVFTMDQITAKLRELAGDNLTKQLEYSRLVVELGKVKN